MKLPFLAEENPPVKPFLAPSHTLRPIGRFFLPATTAPPIAPVAAPPIAPNPPLSKSLANLVSLPLDISVPNKLSINLGAVFINATSASMKNNLVSMFPSSKNELTEICFSITETIANMNILINNDKYVFSVSDNHLLNNPFSDDFGSM